MARKRTKSRSRLSKKRSYRTNSYGASSRRLNKEKKKAVNQTIILAIISILVLLAFLFIIIPGFFRITANFFDNATPFQEADTIAPQIPIVSAPPVATNSANIKIRGFGEPESDLIIVLNGIKENSMKIEEDGSFEFPLILNEGDNTISAYSVDKAENESAITRDYLTLLDTTTPKLELSEPEDGASFESRSNQSVTLKGNTDLDAKIYVNRRVIFPDSDGYFEHTIRLEEGENPIEIKAEDKAKNSTVVNLTLNFKL